MIQTKKLSKLTTLSLLSVSGLALVLSGCANSASLNPVTQSVTTGTVPVAKAASGKFLGGQQPVAGVTVQLYTVGTTGYGSAASTLGASFTTTATGNFTLPTFTCPSPSALTYIVGTGGTPINGSANANIALMAALGQCSTVGASNISVNELTTVAAVWALSPFMGTGCTAAVSYACIGSSSTNAVGITNAFATAANLVSSVTGGVVVPNAAGINANASQTLIELADVVANCINSGGGSASDASTTYSAGTNCGKLFYLTTNGTLVPSDTITAAMSLAQLPATTAPTTAPGLLHQLALASSAYSGTLSAAPTDFTLAVNYTGGGLNTPTSVATDISGNIWVSNSGNSSLSLFSPVGIATTTSTGFAVGTGGTPSAMATDKSGNAWVVDSTNNSLSELNSSGTTLQTLTGNGMSTPTSVAIDAAGNVWVTNSGSTNLSAFTSAGAVLPGSPFAVGSALSAAISPK